MKMGTWYGFEEIGLPLCHAYPEVQFQPTIETIVVRTRLLNYETPINIYRLSARHKSDASYHPICEMDDSKSVFSFVVCLTQPVLYYSVHEMSDGGSNWEGLYRHSLETAKTDCVIRRSQFSPATSEYWQWISNLYSVSPDGDKVICQSCKVPKKGGRGQYSISEFCTISLELVVLCVMAGPHA
jgi:hypothetical protein